MPDTRFVYILRSCRTGALYIGHTNDLQRRLNQHNNAESKSYTAKRGPWELAHAEEHPDRRSAMTREKYLKSCAGAPEKRALAGISDAADNGNPASS